MGGSRGSGAHVDASETGTTSLGPGPKCLELRRLHLDAEGKDTAREGDCLGWGLENTNLKVEVGEG